MNEFGWTVESNGEVIAMFVYERDASAFYDLYAEQYPNVVFELK